VRSICSGLDVIEGPLGHSRLDRTASRCPEFALLKRADERQEFRLLGVDRKRAADGLNEAISPSQTSLRMKFATCSGLLSAPCGRSALFLKAIGMSTLEIEVGDIRPIPVAFTADELGGDAGGWPQDRDARRSG
jgi:hypothetical protein